MFLKLFVCCVWQSWLLLCLHSGGEQRWSARGLVIAEVVVMGRVERRFLMHASHFLIAALVDLIQRCHGYRAVGVRWVLLSIEVVWECGFLRLVNDFHRLFRWHVIKVESLKGVVFTIVFDVIQLWAFENWVVCKRSDYRVKLIETYYRKIVLPFPLIISDGANGRLIIKSPNIAPTLSTFPFRGVPIGGGVFFAWFWNIFDSVTLWIVTWNSNWLVSRANRKFRSYLRV